MSCLCGDLSPSVHLALDMSLVMSEVVIAAVQPLFKSVLIFGFLVVFFANGLFILWFIVGIFIFNIFKVFIVGLFTLEVRITAVIFIVGIGFFIFKVSFKVFAIGLFVLEVRITAIIFVVGIGFFIFEVSFKVLAIGLFVLGLEIGITVVISVVGLEILIITSSCEAPATRESTRYSVEWVSFESFVLYLLDGIHPIDYRRC